MPSCSRGPCAHTPPAWLPVSETGSMQPDLEVVTASLCQRKRVRRAETPLRPRSNLAHCLTTVRPPRAALPRCPSPRRCTHSGISAAPVLPTTARRSFHRFDVPPTRRGVDVRSSGSQCSARGGSGLPGKPHTTARRPGTSEGDRRQRRACDVTVPAGRWRRPSEGSGIVPAPGVELRNPEE